MAQKANKASLPAKASRTQTQAKSSPEHNRVIKGQTDASAMRAEITRMVQTKLRVGAANDPAEHEADRMAEQVVNGKSELVAGGPPAMESMGAGLYQKAIPVYPRVSRLFRVEEQADLQRSEEKVELQRSEEEAELQRSEENAELQRSEEEAELQRSEEKAELQRSEEEAELQRSEEKVELQRSEEKAELQRSEEEAELQRSEENAELQRSEEEAELQRSEENAELQRSEENAELQRSEEDAELKRSEEKAELQRSEEEEAQLKAEEEVSLSAEPEIQEVAAPEIQPAAEVAAPLSPAKAAAPPVLREPVEEAPEEEMQREESETVREKAIDTAPPPPEISRSTLQREEEEAAAQRNAPGKGIAREAPTNHKAGFTTSEATHQKIKSRDGKGQQLPPEIQAKMEAGFGVDFSQVRIHTDAEAAALSESLGARAFTYGRNLYFNSGEYQPYSQPGQLLLAHELTHVVQQGKAPRLNMELMRQMSVARSAQEEQIRASFREILDDLISMAGRVGINIPEIVDNIPGYELFSFFAGYDIIRGTTVEPTGRNLIDGILGLLGPLGNLLFNKLDEYGLIDRSLAWIEGQLSDLNLNRGRLENALSAAWDEMGLLEGIQGNLNILARHFRPIYNDVMTFARNAGDELLEIVKEGLLTPLVGFLDENSPSYVLATKVLGHKFPLDTPVEATTVEILRDFLLLIGKETEVSEMEEKGTLQETADWIDTQLERFFGLVDRFGAIVVRVFEAFSLESLQDIPGVFDGIWTDFTALLQDFLDFAIEVAAKVLELIKNALLAWLATVSDEIPGFHLVTVIIEKDPFTEEEVPRTTENIIRGFMGLVPGGEAKFQQLKETGVVPRAASRIDALVEELGISWPFIRDLFLGIWDSVTIEDLLNPIEAFQRIMDEYGEPIGRLFRFVKGMVEIIVELILEIMNFPLDLIRQIIANTQQAFEQIKNDPIGFLVNLLDAVKLGFTQFFQNILSHLFNGVTTWLFGQLGEAGITIPADLSIGSVLGMAMDVLGITVDNIFERLALKIGQERVDQIKSVVDTLTGIWEFVRDVMERGPIAIWEYIQGKINDLWDMILSGITDWIQTRIITAVTTKLLSMLDPTGIMAVVNSFIAFYNAVQSFIEKLREILEIINTFVLGVVDIANGNIQTAANFLEQALADGIPVAIAFLARQVGLGNLGEKISEMIELARGKINEAIDWLIDQALAAGSALMAMLGMGPEGEEAEEDGTTPEDREMHERYAGEMKSELERAPTDEITTFAEFHASKVARAGELEREYNPLVANEIDGRTVTVSITFETIAEDETDQDVDFTITIAPNATVVVGDADGGLAGAGRYPTGQDPTTRTLDELWDDSIERTRLEHSDGSRETDAEKVIRITMAKAELANQLGGDTDGMIEKILEHEDGKKPRRMNSVVNEDSGPGSGHTTERHVYGLGLVNNRDMLALRVTRKKVGGTQMGNPGRAGAFTSLANANTAIKAALKTGVEDQWKTIRNAMVRNDGSAPFGAGGWPDTMDIRESLAARGEQLLKNWAPALGGSKVRPANMPAWMPGTYPHADYAAAAGDNPLHQWDRDAAVDASKTPLTAAGIPTVTYIRFKRWPAAPNGWYVNSSWPE